MSKEISLPRPLKDRLLLTGTAPLYQICCLEKLPILPNLIFPDSLLSFLLLSPFGGRGIVHFGYYLARQFGNYVTATVETNQAGRMVLRETEQAMIGQKKTLNPRLLLRQIEDRNPKKNEFDQRSVQIYYFYNANGCGFQSPLDAKIENTSKPIIKKL